ncbi:MAG: hypothetical protein V4675_24285 [Verrucomicrobiota bacterium]
METDTTNPTPAEDAALPFDELSPEHAGLLASWKTGDQTGKKPAAKAAAAATAEEAEADDPDDQDEEGEEAEPEEGEAAEPEEGEEPEAEPAEKSKVQKRIDTLTAQKKGGRIGRMKRLRLAHHSL